MKMISRNTNVLWTELDGQIALLDIEAGRYYEANKLGSVIWHLLEVPMQISDIVSKIVSRFRIDQSNCEADVNHFLGELSKLGLIVQTEVTHSQQLCE